MSAMTTRRRLLIASTPLVCVAWTALLVAPSPAMQSATAADLRHHAVVTPALTGDTTGAVVDAVAHAVTPPPVAPESAGLQETADTDVPVENSGRFAVSDVVMVVNDDGSATLSATFRGGGEAMALKTVHIEPDAGALRVASTSMWLPILPGTVSRAGDASDAGGFVVPSGLAPGQTVRVQFQFDDDTCVTTEARTVPRTSAHDEVFPITGDQLGPGRRTAALGECSEPA